MQKIHVRPANLDDTSAISQLYRQHIHVWQRINPQAQVEDVPYSDLTIYERWLHGGPWMSIETGAIHLSHLLRGAGFPVVAEVDGQVYAYTEAYINQEPAPFGHHLSMQHPIVQSDYSDHSLEAALVAFLSEKAKALKCQRLTINLTLPEQAPFYQQQGFQLLATLRRFNLPARTGQGFYRAVENPEVSAKQIENWSLALGRISSSREQWENLWPRTWDSLPEIAKRQRTHRLEFNAAGQPALLCCQQQLYAPRNVDVYCWSPKPLTAQLLTSIRDWAHRESYRTLVLSVLENTVKTLGPEAEPDGYTQETYSLTL